MKKIVQVLLASTILAIAGVASADPVIDVWTCKINEGKTAEDVEAAGKIWVEIVRKITGNDEITSTMATSVVGDSQTFRWFDTYPSLEAYAAAQTTMNSSDEFTAAIEALDAVQECKGNRLYRGVVVD